MTAMLIVRADVDPSVREAFDAWYAAEHLSDAHKAFNTLQARRGWSCLEPNVHIAFYEFAGIDDANAAIASGAIKDLIREFDRHWYGKVTRTREVVEVIQAL